MSKRKHEKWLRVLLGIIALNLTLLSLYVLDVLPQAKAHKGIEASVLPIDADGVMRVRLVQEVVPVRIEETNELIDVRVKNTVDTNIEAVDVGIFNPLPVRIRD